MNNIETETQAQELFAYCARLDKAGKESAAHRDFFAAAKIARIGMHKDGLMPLIDEDGKYYYVQEQVAIAAHHAREDVAAIVGVQLSLLKRLDRNRNYMLAIIALLIYIVIELK